MHEIETVEAVSDSPSGYLHSSNKHPVRRSSRKTGPPSCLQMTLNPQRKRYTEESVPLAEDMEEKEEKEEKEEEAGDPQ